MIVDPSDTMDGVLWDLWQRCVLAARFAGRVPAEAVQVLIGESRKMIADAGYTVHTNHILASVYFTLHWDCDQPTDRVFETMLAFELEEFFKERMS